MASQSISPAIRAFQARLHFLLAGLDVEAPLVALLDDRHRRDPAGRAGADQSLVRALRDNLVALVPGLEELGADFFVVAIAAGCELVPARSEDRAQRLVVVLADGVGQRIRRRLRRGEATQLRRRWRLRDRSR
jgi:hypothetical protein